MTQQPRSKKRQIDGVLLVDKPYDISSNGALQKARWLFNAAKAGHTGVLDPLATGLLPVCLGEATKFSSYLLDADKGYRAHVRFGVVTTTGDIEGEIVRERPIVFDREQLLQVMSQFVGEIEQVPPMYSALKHQGKPLYEYARQGIEIKREARQITIHSLQLVSLDGADAVIDVVCSKGTYIRTLAEDIGEVLGCGAHLTGLRRTATGGFSLQQAITLEALEALTMPEREALLMPPDVLVRHLPEIVLSEEDAGRFNHGQAVRFDEKYERMPRFRVYHQLTREFLGLGELRDHTILHPLRLLAVKDVKV
ncbi:tRNA pseudouridine(55) synthase TruB [Paludibacterium denitrificans]|uniref:tRNA pseudouridine synthase B n=1 Tax=Paludibacterium denitrificans TaxID=2675226 RepID=A0A844GCP6_9NEIS|nr:tRNA pseudouridine(55) synthase TruB [Paludibacterium denitrificans]MTD32375.1 tRNA pseudouridine(55) synthase TruB [Paludibacterium denitrificans]HJV07475.1 tRNA pseudouridine(55) synthase TruB [Chromobacteriaceae bacterium]